jgi:ferredoxin/flavodoxin---NADP+ reductase
MTEVTITDHWKIANNVFEIRFPKIASFVAGQVINVSVKNFPPRMYSIASGEQDDYLAILFDVKPQGEVTPLLRDMQKGDKVHISAPFGKFRCAEEKAAWIASGTGIAPFRSMLRSGQGLQKTLLHGSRALDTFYYQNEFAAILGENYIRCCSQQSAEGIFAGRITRYLEELEELPTDQRYYLCGSTEMVVEVRDLLIAKNIPYSNIMAEIYF